MGESSMAWISVSSTVLLLRNRGDAAELEAVRLAQ
jgi:hypothetical protein